MLWIVSLSSYHSILIPDCFSIIILKFEILIELLNLSDYVTILRIIFKSTNIGNIKMILLIFNLSYIDDIDNKNQEPKI